MVDLNGHEAGNGGHSQGKPTAYRDSSTRRDGVTGKKDPPEWMTDGPLGGCLADLQKINLLRTCGVPIMCLIASREAQEVGRDHIAATVNDKGRYYS